MAVVTMNLGWPMVNNGLVDPYAAASGFDAVWTNNIDNSSWTCSFSWDNPVGNMANGTHTFTFRFRKETGTGTPTAQVQILDGGDAVIASSPVTGITSTTQQDIAVSIPSTSLNGRYGGLDGLYAKVITVAAGGSKNALSAVQLNGATWVGDITSVNIDVEAGVAVRKSGELYFAEVFVVPPAGGESVAKVYLK